MTEIYVSTDVETDGPIPGKYSMLSFGSVAFLESGEEVGEFGRNLIRFADQDENPETMAWWATQPEAWAACRKDQVDPSGAMLDYVRWLKKLPGKPVFVGYPAGFDFLFVYWYLIKYAGESPFSFSALDIKTYVMAVLGTEYRESTKKNMPKSWFPPDAPHTHVALDDAREQGKLFINILKAGKELREDAWRERDPAASGYEGYGTLPKL